MACYGCKYLEEDTSVNACDCKMCDELSEDDFEKYFCNDEDGCPHYAEQDFTEIDKYYEELNGGIE